MDIYECIALKAYTKFAEVNAPALTRSIIQQLEGMWLEKTADLINF